MQVMVKCPSCGETGRAEEANARAGIECPSCGVKFVSDVKMGFWQRQAARSPMVRYWWLAPLCLAAALAQYGFVSWVAVVVVVGLGLLAGIFVRLGKIAGKNQ